MSILSLSDEECERNMHQSRLGLISEFQMLCEEALSHINIFCLTDITMMKALTVYLVFVVSLSIDMASAKNCCRWLALIDLALKAYGR